MSSGVFVMIRWMLGFVSPSELLLLRFLPASVAAIIIILVFYRDPVRSMLPKVWWYFLPREAIAVLGFHFTLIYCETVLPAGVAALIVAIWPVMTIFAASVVLGEKITIGKLAGGLLAFAGVAAVVVLGAEEEVAVLDISQGQWIRYSLILLIAPLSSAFVTSITRWYLTRTEGEEMPDAFLFSLMCRAPSGVYAILAYFLFRRQVPFMETLPHLPPLFWVFVAVLAFFSSLAGFWLWNRCLQELHATSVASFSYLQTLFALLIAWAALGESMSIVKIMAGVVIIAGVVIANVERRPFIFDGERPVRGEYPISPSN